MSDITVQNMPEGVTESAWAQFKDVRFWLANLYEFCLNERQYLKTEKGRQAVEESRLLLNADKYVNDLNTWHIWLVTLMIAFNDLRWKNVNLSTSPPPKLTDALLLSLIKHSMFEGQDLNVTVKHSFKLNSSEKKVLKELAQRLS